MDAQSTSFRLSLLFSKNSTLSCGMTAESLKRITFSTFEDSHTALFSFRLPSQVCSNTLRMACMPPHMTSTDLKPRQITPVLQSTQRRFTLAHSQWLHRGVSSRLKPCSLQTFARTRRTPFNHTTLSFIGHRLHLHKQHDRFRLRVSSNPCHPVRWSPCPRVRPLSITISRPHQLHTSPCLPFNQHLLGRMQTIDKGTRLCQKEIRR